MAVYRYGTKVKGKAVAALASVLTSSVPGKKYQIQLDTDSIPDANKKAVLETLKANLETSEWKIKILYAEIRDNQITLQITGSPFLWAALIVFLPQILSLVGISIAAITVYMLLEAVVQNWVQILALLITIFGGLTAYTYVTRKPKEVTETVE